MKILLITLVTLTILACNSKDFKGGNSYTITFDDNPKAIDTSHSALIDTNLVKYKVIDSLITK